MATSGRTNSRSGSPRNGGRTSGRADDKASDKPKGHAADRRDGGAGGSTKGDGDRRRNGHAPSKMGAAEVVRLAVEQLAELTGKVAEGVSELCRSGEGWVVTVEVVELERIPSSTDVVGSYEVLLDDDGDLLEYRRVARWVRSQPREG